MTLSCIYKGYNESGSRPVKLCMMITSIMLYSFIPVSVTLKDETELVFFYPVLFSLCSLVIYDHELNQLMLITFSNFSVSGTSCLSKSLQLILGDFVARCLKLYAVMTSITLYTHTGFRDLDPFSRS